MRKLYVETITLFVGGGGCSRQVWLCSHAEACSLTFSLKVLRCAEGGGGGLVRAAWWQVSLPKPLVLTCSCIACPLVGVSPYWW